MDIAGIAPGTVIGRWTVLDTYEKTSKGERNGSADASAVQNVMFCNEV